MTELAGRLAAALFPQESPVGVAHSIREQILADALQASASPLTLLKVLRALEADPRCRGSLGRELLAALRRRAIETPDLAPERLAAGSNHRPEP